MANAWLTITDTPCTKAKSLRKTSFGSGRDGSGIHRGEQSSTLTRMERSDAEQTRKRDEHRTWFERFVEVIHRRVSEPPFFFVCVGIVVIWFASAPLFSSAKSWQVVIHTIGSVLTLLLLVLLQNAGRRDAEAAQEKLNVLAEGLAALMESRSADDVELHKAASHLRDAVGLEARH